MKNTTLISFIRNPDPDNSVTGKAGLAPEDNIAFSSNR